ncbi:efflux RND transporter permease subunit [Permianibacter sp. IMCC34836]|uniref:efflux RND transporter permease subunit n=1 Tax=Permianibacter fluminis TaxID=2738515 RepID=UPI00155715D2|nr:efflux RND transporter permease subunit [Permianibacter fluminis]NQD37553.1 efflux RND transporter permease subunit [Permianibacter fluminis]
MTLIELSMRRPVTVSMGVVAMLVFGLVLLGRLGLTLLPDLSYPTLTVRTQYTGAAPSEVENLISKPIEESVGVIKNVRSVRSISRAGQSDVLLEFNWGTDMGLAGIDVREKLDLVQLPLDVQRPTLLRFNPSLDPIVRLSLSRPLAEGQTRTAAAAEQNLTWLRRLADEQVKKQLEAIEGVAAVKISGGYEDEVQINIDQEKVSQLGLTIEQIAQHLQAENVNLSGGRLEEGSQQLLVRTINQYQSVQEMADTIVASNDGKPVYLRDIAQVAMRYKEREAVTRINGEEAVEIALYKEGDANTVAVAHKIKARLEELSKSLGDGLKLENIYDQSLFIEDAVGEVVANGIEGGILATIILYLFLRNVWATVIIALSIPVAVVISFNLMYAAGVTLNIMSLGGIALSIGMLIDNGIVVLENIDTHRKLGKPVFQAAREGTAEVAGAVTASTLTSIAVFLPLVFVQGIAGQLFRDQALTVTFSQIVSLFIGFTLVPMLAVVGQRKTAESHPELAVHRRQDSNLPQPAKQSLDIPETPPIERYPSRFRSGLAAIFSALTPAIVSKLIVNPTAAVIKWIRKTPIIAILMSWLLFVAGLVGKLMHRLFKPIVDAFNYLYTKLEQGYDSLIQQALSRKLLVITIALSLFAISVFMLSRIGVELIPQLAQGEFVANLRAAPGTPLAKTDEILLKAHRIAAAMPEVERSFAVAGSGNRLDASPDKGGENVGELNVVLKKPVAQHTEAEVMRRLREQLSQLPGVQVEVERRALFTFKTPLEVELIGYNMDDLRASSAQLVGLMRAKDRFIDIRSTVEEGYPELQILFDHERAAKLNLSVPDVAQRVVKKLRGDIATRYAFRDRKIDVVVRLDEVSRNSVEEVRQIIVNSDPKTPIPLSAIAEVKLAVGPSEIHRIGQERVAIVSANLHYGDLGEAAAEVQQLIKQLPERSGIEIRLAGQNEEMQVSFRSLQFALLLALFLVYLVMASQFESLLHPFVIMFSVPLALVGAVLALVLTKQTISVVVFIGLIMLAGIVVNNAIVLIDRINQLRAEDLQKLAAVREAGRSRLRPIMMTMLTTVLGMVPLALGIGEGAEIRAPMAITVIGGITVSTLLTLVVIPVLYTLLDRSE